MKTSADINRGVYTTEELGLLRLSLYKEIMLCMREAGKVGE